LVNPRAFTHRCCKLVNDQSPISLDNTSRRMKLLASFQSHQRPDSVTSAPGRLKACKTIGRCIPIAPIRFALDQRQ
jgi:hypothetical protein